MTKVKPDHDYEGFEPDDSPLLDKLNENLVLENEDEGYEHHQVSRDHDFEGEGVFCLHWDSWGPVGSDSTGYVSGRTQCGFPEASHPNARPEYVEAFNAADQAWWLRSREFTQEQRDSSFYRRDREKYMAEFVKAVVS